jgi:hypothetical protein
MQRAGQHLHSASGLGHDLVYVPLLADLRHVIPFGGQVPAVGAHADHRHVMRPGRRTRQAGFRQPIK